jgi:uncharacterized protein YodC (DUF2158 family)
MMNEIKIGSMVKLKSGGPKMVVEAIVETVEHKVVIRVAHCVWWNEDTKCHSRVHVPVDGLVEAPIKDYTFTEIMYDNNRVPFRARLCNSTGKLDFLSHGTHDTYVVSLWESIMDKINHQLRLNPRES